MRRRLYAPGSSADVVDEYLRAEARAGRSEPSPPVDTEDREGGAAPAPARAPAPRGGGNVMLVASAVGLLLLGTFWIWWSGSSAHIPERVAPPAAPGRTVLLYSRLENPESAPDRVTFEPADERAVFFADGRVLTVTLRCVGRGSVRIRAAEERFDFRCDDRLRTTTRYSAEPVRGAFQIVGRTVGDVVWGLRITTVTGGS